MDDSLKQEYAKRLAELAEAERKRDARLAQLETLPDPVNSVAVISDQPKQPRYVGNCKCCNAPITFEHHGMCTRCRKWLADYKARAAMRHDLIGFNMPTTQSQPTDEVIRKQVGDWRKEKCEECGCYLPAHYDRCSKAQESIACSN